MNFTLWTSGVPQVEDMVDDSMSNLLREVTTHSSGKLAEADEDERNKAEILRMERVRRRIDSIVTDKTTAEALKPYFHYFCKRPGFSDDYLQVFNRPNVTLVDTAGTGVERVTAKGLVVGGHEYELDCIIYATGFDFMTSYTRECGISIVGKAGKSLDEHWDCGAKTLFGMQTNGFPNLFLLSMVQAGISINYLHTADAQSKYIADLVLHCLQNEIGSVEPTEEAVNEWVGLCLEFSGPRRKFQESCTPSYLNFEGNRPKELDLNAPFGGGPLKYFEQLDAMKRERFATRMLFEARETR
jgi:cyclohexanone monooxygenase